MIDSGKTCGNTVAKWWFYIGKILQPIVDDCLILFHQWNNLLVFSKNFTTNPLHFPQAKYPANLSLNKLFTQFPHHLLLKLLNNN